MKENQEGIQNYIIVKHELIIPSFVLTHFPILAVKFESLLHTKKYVLNCNDQA
jgi:hypothetical protein